MAGTGRIADLVKRLEALGSDSFRESLSRRMAEKTLDLIDRGYRERKDPYGVPWAPTKQPNPILERSGAFRASWRPVAILPHGFTVEAESIDYAIVHQTGRKDGALVARKTVPDASRGLGEWEKPLDDVVVEAITEAMR